MLSQMKHALRVTAFAAVMGLFSLPLIAPTIAWATPLEDVAAQMQPGEWRVLQTSNLSTIMKNGSLSGNINVYADSATWDPASRRFLFIGSYHNSPYTFATYRDSDNTWAPGPALPGIPFSQVFVGHGADHNAVDTNRGLFYYRPNAYSQNKVFRYNVAANSWTTLPTLINWYINCCGSLSYFPELDGLVYVNGGNDGLNIFRESTGQWTVLVPANQVSDLEPASTWTFSQYNPIHKVLVFGDGNSRALYKLDQTGRVTRLRNLPVNLYDGTGNNGVFTVDPVSGDYLILTASSRQFYSYDVLTDTWQSRSNRPPSVVGSAAVVATPVSNYGVTLFVYNNGGGSYGVLIYKHSASTPSNPAPSNAAPSAPTALQAAQ